MCSCLCVTGGEGRDPGGFSLFQLLFQLCWNPGTLLGCFIPTQTEQLLHPPGFNLGVKSPLLNITTFNHLSGFFGLHHLSFLVSFFGHNSRFFLSFPFFFITLDLHPSLSSLTVTALCLNHFARGEKEINSNEPLGFVPDNPKADFLGQFFHPSFCSDCN